MLYFDLRPGPKCHSRWCTGRKWHIPMAVMRGNRVCRNWLMKWENLKNSHGTLIDWCTGREWPLNCMTVVSAWWQLNIRFQTSSGRQTIIWASWVADNWRRDVVGKATSGRRGLWALMSWGPEKMLIRCRKESHHPAEWPLGLWLSIRRTRKTQHDGHKSECQNIAVLAIKWEVNILLKKSSCICHYHCVCYSLRQYVSCMNLHMTIQQ